MTDTIDVEVIPTIATDTYTNLEVVGGIQKLTGLGGMGGVLHTIQIYDDAAQDAAFLIHLFKALPTGTYADSVALTLDADDKGKLIGTIPFASSLYEAIGDDSNANLNNVGFSFGQTPEYGALYAIAVLNGSTPTYGTTTDLRFRYAVLPG